MTTCQISKLHERSLDADLALALSLNGRELLRDEPPLKILLMSATLEGERLSRLLDDAPVVSSEGRMYPVDIRWGRPFQPGEFIEPRVVECVLHALADQAGSVLVFLPGQAEIRRVHQSLQDMLGERSDILLCPLHGELDLNAQRAAIDPAPAGKRKVVLATNIAETSLTIDGVRVVVDAGLARVPRFDPGSAEILQADLAGLALQLARWGVTPDQLRWLDQPPAAAFSQAQDLLARLSAFKAGSRDNLSEHGQAMAELPAHPRIAHLLLRGQGLGLAAMACDVAALLGERDIQRGGGADLHSRLALISGESKTARGGQGGVQRARQLARQYRGLLRGKAGAGVADPDHPRWLGALLALAYPDRVAQQRREGGAEYRLANGRAALFAEVDALMKCPWLVVADLGSRQGQREERIYLAAEFDPALLDDVLAEQVERIDILDWDDREQVLRAERQTKVGELVLSREPLPGLDDDARARALLGLVRRKGLNLLTWTPELRQWQARVALLRQLDLDKTGQSEWPDLSDEALLATLEGWLQPYLGKVSRLSHFAALDLSSMLRNLLPWPLPQRLDEWAPAHLAVPSGSHIRLDYSENPPILAVRLQELFGLADTPRIAQGRQQVKLHLLSPARRPVQVTQDLANFWRTTYAEVKKDLKGRYPKHYWPDDPLVAEATARAKPRGT